MIDWLKKIFCIKSDKEDEELFIEEYNL